MPQIIGLFNRQYPGIEIDLRLGNAHRIIEIILEGEVDFGFAGKVKRFSRLTDILVHQEQLLIVASPDHYLSSKKQITVNELIKTPFIGREKGTQTQAVVKKWFEKNIGRNYPKKSIELENVEAAKRIVEAGFGITIIPESAVKREINTGLLKSIKLKGFDHSVNFHIFYFKGKIFSKAVETFLKMLAGIRLLSHSENLEDSLKALKG